MTSGIFENCWMLLVGFLNNLPRAEPKPGCISFEVIVNSTSVSVLVAGKWRDSDSVATFQAYDPCLGEPLKKIYPVSSREEAIEAVQAGSEAADALRTTSDEKVANFLDAFAVGIEYRAGELVDLAHAETGLQKSPRLKELELPRTTDQLHQAARAAREGTWRRPILDGAA